MSDQERPTDQIDVQSVDELASPAESLLDRSLASLMRWDWEKLAWLGLLLISAALRLVDLQSRSMSHDESEHAWFAYNLYAGKGYEHSPVYHGPFIYHLMALFYLIFGDNTVTARVPTALIGLGLVWLIWLLRPWIGKFGAFFAAAMVAFSPALLHYSRHTRHDIYELFWALLLIVAVFRYCTLASQAGAADQEQAVGKPGSRPDLWLYVMAVALSLALASKEDAFIHGALLGIFIMAIIAMRWVLWRFIPDYPAEEQERPLQVTRRDMIMLIAAMALSLAGVLLYRLFNLSRVTSGGNVLSTVLLLAVIALPPALAIGLIVWHLRRRQASGAPPLAFSPAMDVAMLLGALILPWLSPFLIKLLGYDLVNYESMEVIMPALSVLIGFFGIALVVGIFWNARRWLIAASLFYAIFILLFTGFFTNGKGIATGLVGSLGYWLTQQDVARGSQPWYYYFIVVPLYEFLPIILSIPVLLAAWLRRNRVSLALLALLLVLLIAWIAARAVWDGAEAGSAQELLITLLTIATLGVALLAAIWGGLAAYPRAAGAFVAFLPFWVLGAWVAYSFAGEKMPWIATSIALPMCIAGGWWLGRLVEQVDWPAVRQRGGIWIALAVAPLVAALIALFSAQPFRGRTIAELSATGQWLAALAVAAGALALIYYQGRRLGWQQAGRVIGLTAIGLLALWTVRTTYMLNFVNYDYVSEYLFYAHASPDPQMVMDQVEKISQRTAGDKQLKVAYDDDAAWPFNWYLRDWPNAVYFGANPTRESFQDAPLAIVGSKNLDKARPYLQRDYHEFDHRLIWWPDEGYKTTSWEKIKLGLSDPAKRKEFLDVVLWRKFPTPLSQWPLVHRFSLFVRKDVAAKMWDYGSQPAAAAAVVDPYAQGLREVEATQVLGGGPGSDPGLLSFPRNAAVAPDGALFVADSGNHRIVQFGPDGSFIGQWGSSCDLYAEGQPGCVDPDGAGPLQLGDGQLREPWGVAIGPNGHVYVADTWNHRVVVFDSQGNFLNKWGTFVTTDGQAIGNEGGFWGPRAIAIDAAGNIYVTDTGNKRIQVFDADGAFLGQFGGGGAVEGRLDEPVGLAIAPAQDGQPGGILYVADTWNRRVQKFDVAFFELLPGADEGSKPNFTFVKEWPIQGWSSQSVVNKPYLAVDSQGLVYVTDPEGYRVLVFDSEGNFKATFGQYGSDLKSFAMPNGIAAGPANQVYVADVDNHRILVFPPVQ